MTTHCYINIMQTESAVCPKNSTSTALIQLCDKWYEILDNDKLTGVVFLDIRKAFDSVDHNKLLHKMKTQFGFTNIELDWFQSYLTNREQVCHINGKFSSSKNIITGVRRVPPRTTTVLALYT